MATRGRPPKLERRRDHWLRVRVSDDELESMDVARECAGENRSDYLRRLVREDGLRERDCVPAPEPEPEVPAEPEEQAP
jgi:hypothetical protein